MKRLLSILLVMLLTACGGGKLYKSSNVDNLQIATRINKVQASLDIYSVSPSCQSVYEGSIALDKKRLDIGLEPGKPKILVVGFSSSSFLGSSSSSMQVKAPLQPKNGYRYLLGVSYEDDIYSVRLYEINRRSGSKRELDLQKSVTCKH